MDIRVQAPGVEAAEGGGGGGGRGIGRESMSESAGQQTNHLLHHMHQADLCIRKGTGRARTGLCMLCVHSATGSAQGERVDCMGERNCAGGRAVVH